MNKALCGNSGLITGAGKSINVYQWDIPVDSYPPLVIEYGTYCNFSSWELIDEALPFDCYAKLQLPPDMDEITGTIIIRDLNIYEGGPKNIVKYVYSFTFDYDYSINKKQDVIINQPVVKNNLYGIDINNEN